MDLVFVLLSLFIKLRISDLSPYRFRLFLIFFSPTTQGEENIAALKDLNAIKFDVEAYYDIKTNKIYDNYPIMKFQELIYKQIQKSLHFTIADEILNKLPEVTFARFVSRSQTIATAFLHVPLSGFIKLNHQEYEDNLLLTVGLPPVMGNLCPICNSSLGSSLMKTIAYQSAQSLPIKGMIQC